MNIARHAPEPAITGIEDIKFIVSCITFAPSCVDMGWDWEVHPVDGNFLRGYAIRTTFRRPERDSGEIATGYGRWWFVPEDITLSGVVKTAFKAAMLILEHELMESFKFQGKRPFDPHNSITDLISLSDDNPEITWNPKVSLKRRVNMKFSEWCKVIGLSAVTIAFVLAVLYGLWQLLIVTGRAIIK